MLVFGNHGIRFVYTVSTHMLFLDVRHLAAVTTLCQAAAGRKSQVSVFRRNLLMLLFEN